MVHFFLMARKKRMWITAFAVAISLFGFASAASAATIYSQPDSSTFLQAGTNGIGNYGSILIPGNLGTYPPITLATSSSPFGGTLSGLEIMVQDARAGADTGQSSPGVFIETFASANCTGSPIYANNVFLGMFFGASQTTISVNISGLGIDLTSVQCIQIVNLSDGYAANAPGAGMYGNAAGLPYGYLTTNGTPLPGQIVTTQIDSVSPTDQSTTASSSVTFTMVYDLSSTTSELDEAAMQLVDISKNYQTVYSGPFASTTPGIGQAASITLTLIDGDTYQWQPYLTDDSGDAVFAANYPAPTSGVASDGDAQFSVGTNNLSSYLGASSTSALYTLSTTTCSITNIAGCFQNALIWAFYPSNQMLDLVGTDGSLVKNKPPFGYFFVNIEALESLSATGTPAFTLEEDAPIMTYIFQPLVAGLVGVIWFGFGVWFFLHVRDIVP